MVPFRVNCGCVHIIDEEGYELENVIVRKEIAKFAIELEKRMKEKDAEKGNSWEGMDIKRLYSKIEDHDLDWFELRLDSPEEIKEIMIDQANYIMMLWNRLRG